MAELNIQELLGKVLENPDAIGRVVSLMNSPEGKAIGSMLGSMTEGNPPPTEEDASTQAIAAVEVPPKRDEAACRTALLKALIPYLSENRRSKVEIIMKLMQVMQTVSQAGVLSSGLLKS